MLRELFDSLQRRPRPEDVAEMIYTGFGDRLTSPELRILDRAVRGSLRRAAHQFTSMMQDFHRPTVPARQSMRGDALFGGTYLKHDPSSSIRSILEDPKVFLAKLQYFSHQIRKTVGASDFKKDRLNDQARLDAGLDISRRRYNKMFRFLGRFEEKIATYKVELRKYRASRIAKSSLATEISWEDFSADPWAACLVAYFSARSNRRSVFTNKSQDRPYDRICDMLYDRFLKSPTAAGWRAIAHVLPDGDVVCNLEPQDKMKLFGLWTSVLEDLALLLRDTWKKSSFNRQTMVVGRGDDSSTWNSVAGAWNAARQGWLGLVVGIGMEDLLDRLSIGKVMRLMAGDVARWHASSGGQLEPDTLVWAELPAPWEVFSGEATLTRAQVEAVCAKHGVDPVKKGWTWAKEGRKAVPWKPTPELVHGVVVTHPGLATVLRAAGWFSGKGASPVAQAVEIRRDDTGAVVQAGPMKMEKEGARGRMSE